MSLVNTCGHCHLALYPREITENPKRGFSKFMNQICHCFDSRPMPDIFRTDMNYLAFRSSSDEMITDSVFAANGRHFLAFHCLIIKSLFLLNGFFLTSITTTIFVPKKIFKTDAKSMSFGNVIEAFWQS
jgi:hypothetical protein